VSWVFNSEARIFAHLRSAPLSTDCSPLALLFRLLGMGALHVLRELSPLLDFDKCDSI